MSAIATWSSGRWRNRFRPLRAYVESYTSHHMVTNQRSNVDGDRARAVAYLHSVHVDTPTPPGAYGAGRSARGDPAVPRLEGDASESPGSAPEPDQGADRDAVHAAPERRGEQPPGGGVVLDVG